MFAKVKFLIDRHRRAGVITITVLATGIFFVSQLSSTFNNFFNAPSVLAFAILLLVADLAIAVDGVMNTRRTVQISREQDYLMSTLIAVADEMQPNSTGDLLEYSGGSIAPLIRRLVERDITVRVLVKHPDTCNDYQRRRTQASLESLYTTVVDHYPGRIEVRCYRAPFSLRGRKLGGRFLEVGWLTSDFERGTAFGRVNPSIYLDPSAPNGDYMLAFFEKTFQDLWDRPDTCDGRCAMPA